MTSQGDQCSLGRSFMGGEGMRRSTELSWIVTPYFFGVVMTLVDHFGWSSPFLLRHLEGGFIHMLLFFCGIFFCCLGMFVCLLMTPQKKSDPSAEGSFGVGFGIVNFLIGCWGAGTTVAQIVKECVLGALVEVLQRSKWPSIGTTSGYGRQFTAFELCFLLLVPQCFWICFKRICGGPWQLCDVFGSFCFQ